MKKKNINLLVKKGHVVGLHSHTHPYRIANMRLNDQKKEYLENINQISKISNFKQSFYKSLAHPSGSFDKKIFPFFKKQKIKIGFRHTMTNGKKINKNIYEIARQDHSNILKLINKILDEKKLNNTILKIIFALKKRENYVEKYLKNIQRDTMNYDLLILLENNKKIKITNQENIYQFQIKGNVNGMNSIFCHIYRFRNFIKNYKYVCFVEDDNFIFNDGLKKLVKVF